MNEKTARRVEDLVSTWPPLSESLKVQLSKVLAENTNPVAIVATQKIEDDAA